MWGREERKEGEEGGRRVRLSEAHGDRDREEEARGAKLKLIKDLQYKKRKERAKKKKLWTHSQRRKMLLNRSQWWAPAQKH